jgi:hypothetical protein
VQADSGASCPPARPRLAQSTLLAIALPSHADNVEAKLPTKPLPDASTQGGALQQDAQFCETQPVAAVEDELWCSGVEVGSDAAAAADHTRDKLPEGDSPPVECVDVAEALLGCGGVPNDGGGAAAMTPHTPESADDDAQECATQAADGSQYYYCHYSGEAEEGGDGGPLHAPASNGYGGGGPPKEAEEAYDEDAVEMADVDTAAASSSGGKEALRRSAAGDGDGLEPTQNTAAVSSKRALAAAAAVAPPMPTLLLPSERLKKRFGPSFGPASGGVGTSKAPQPLQRVVSGGRGGAGSRGAAPDVELLLREPEEDELDSEEDAAAEPRRRRFWSAEEEAALRRGHARHSGERYVWSRIKLEDDASATPRLAGRTAVDLKGARSVFRRRHPMRMMTSVR